MDAIRRYTGFEELAAVDGGEIEAHPALLAKLCGHLRSDLVAARADGGADGGVHIGGMRAETFAHGGQSRSRDARGRPAPPRVDGGDGAPAGIDQEQRHAIGRLHGDDCAGRIFEQGVTLPEDAAPASGGDAGSRVNLLQRGEMSKLRRNIRVARTETVHQPRETVQRGGAVDVLRVAIEQGRESY